jgi:hypothetical protein
MTARHLTTARLLAGTESSIRPGMSTWHVAIGALAHMCAAELAQFRGQPPTVIARRATEWVAANVKDVRVLGNMPKARMQIAAAACSYMHRFAPGLDAKYLGSEIAFDGGRIDLAWDVPDHGVIIDELKTQTWVRLDINSAMLEQARRYKSFGVNQWGGGFCGVRLLPLRHPAEARFVPARGPIMRLADSVVSGIPWMASL